MVLEQRMDAPKKHTRFYWLFAIMLGMVAVRNVLHIEFPVIAFLAIVAAIAMFCEKDEIIAFSVACIPLSTAFQYKYALFIIIIIYCVRFSEEIRITSKVIPIVLMFIWEILHIVMGEFLWLELLRGFAELIFLAFLFSIEKDRFDLKLISRIFSITTVIICFYILLIQLEQNSYDFSKLFSGSLRFGAADDDIENFGLNFNENGLGGICNLAIIGTLLVADSNKLKMVDIITVGLLAFFGAMTVSRTFLICFVTIMMYYFVFQNGGAKKKTERFIGVLVVFVISFFLLQAILPQVIERFIERFAEEDITGGRSELFGFYNEHITSSPIYTFFGVGLQDIQEKISDIHSVSVNVCHNGYQELLVAWGIPGAVLFASLICSICSKPKENNIKRSLLQYGPLFLILVISLAGQLITKGINLLGLSFAYLCLKDINNKEEPDLFNVEQPSGVRL